MKCVQIYKDGTMDELELSFKKTKMKINLDNIIKIFNKFSKSQGEDNLKELYNWKYENKIIACYGWYDGEAGFENKHDLPPSGKSKFLDEDSSAQLLFGDIFLVRIDNKKICDFQVSDYGEFYNIIFGGFDDCDTETDGEDINSEEEEDPDYDPDINDIEEEYEILSGNDSELEEDTSEY